VVFSPDVGQRRQRHVPKWRGLVTEIVHIEISVIENISGESSDTPAE